MSNREVFQFSWIISARKPGYQPVLVQQANRQVPLFSHDDDHSQPRYHHKGQNESIFFIAEKLQIQWTRDYSQAKAACNPAPLPFLLEGYLLMYCHVIETHPGHFHHQSPSDPRRGRRGFCLFGIPLLINVPLFFCLNSTLDD